MIGKDICKRIRDIRMSMKLTQSQFAELVNMSEDSIGKIERGVTVPTVETLNKISTALKIHIEDLLPPYKGKKKGKAKSAAIDGLVTYLKTRPSEDVEFIHDLAVRILERDK